MRFPWNRRPNGGIRLEFVPSDEEAASTAEPAPLELPSAMQHLNIAAKRRFAALFFGFHSTTDVLILSFVPLALRFAGVSILSSATLRAASTVLAVLLSSLVLTCVRSQSKRKIVGGLAILLALMPLGGLVYTLNPMNVGYIPAAVVKQANVSFLRLSFPNWENDNCRAAQLWPDFSQKDNNASNWLPPEVGITPSSVNLSETATGTTVDPGVTTLATGLASSPVVSGVSTPRVDQATRPQSWLPTSDVPPPYSGGYTPDRVPSEVPVRSTVTYELRTPTAPQFPDGRGPPIPGRPEWVQNAFDGASRIPYNVRARRDINGAVGTRIEADRRYPQNLGGSLMTANNGYTGDNNVVVENNVNSQPPEFVGDQPTMVRVPQRPSPSFVPPPPAFEVEPNPYSRRVADARQPMETRQKQLVSNVVADPDADINHTQRTSEDLTNITTSSTNTTDSFWMRISHNLEADSLLGFYLVILALLTLFDTFFKLVSQICDGLYRDYLDQLDYSDRIGDHLPFVHGATGFLITLVAAAAWHYRCELLPTIGDPSVVFISFASIPLILALSVFCKFPVPDKRAHLKVEPVTPNQIGVLRNARALLLASTLVVLGATLGAEQSFVLWRLIDAEADFFFTITFLSIPIMVSSLMVRATSLRRTSAIRRSLLIALLTVQIRFVAYAWLPEHISQPGQLYWLLPLQLLTPFGTTFVWNTIDSFAQQVSFPQDDGSLRRQLHFAYWVLGAASGTLLAGFGYDRFGFMVTFTSLSVASGVWAMLLLCMTRFLPLHHIGTSNSLRYAKLLDREEEISSKRPINNFQEVDESDADDDTVEFDVSAGTSQIAGGEPAKR